MRRLAQSHLRDERSAATLQPTALVHEAHLQVVAQALPD
jgi:ECF sigma factor